MANLTEDEKQAKKERNLKFAEIMRFANEHFGEEIFIGKDGVPQLAPDAPPVGEIGTVSEPELVVEKDGHTPIDRHRLSEILTNGQRLAWQHRAHDPQLNKWAQDAQHFRNEFGL